MNPVVKDLGGAKLLAIPTDRFKSEYLSIRFLLPVEEKLVQQNMILFSLLSRGTEKHPSILLLNRYLDELYSTNVSMYSQRLGDMHCLGYSADFLAARFVGGGVGLLPQVLSVMHDLFYAPLREGGLFCNDYLESEKSNLRDSIRSVINNPSVYARCQCRKLLCRGEPYALPLLGEEETIEGIDARLMTEYYEQLMSRLVPTFLYAGSTPPDEVAALIKQIFPQYGKSSDAYHTTLKGVEGDVLYASEEMPLCQGKLSLGFRCDISSGHRLAPALLVFNQIYGASPASKLFLNVRERRSLCYSCGSSVRLAKGVMYANAGMKPENFEVTRDAMLSEFEAMRRGDFTDVEFDAAHRALEHSYRQSFDHPASICSFYANRGLMGIDTTLEDYHRSIAGVTREDVIEVGEHIAHGATFFLRGTETVGEVDE